MFLKHAPMAYVTTTDSKDILSKEKLTESQKEEVSSREAGDGKSSELSNVNISEMEFASKSSSSKSDAPVDEVSQEPYAVRYIQNGKFRTSLRGDVNNDGKVTLTDAAMLELYYIGNIKDGERGFDAKKADVNNDGKVTLTDIAKIEQDIIGLIDLNPEKK